MNPVFDIFLGATGWVLPPAVRRGEPVCPGREAGRRASAAGPGMAHRCVPWDKRVNRGNPTKEGEQVGVAFLLVTFLWPRKEKSLAKPRSGGETPSKAAPSCPAWRSHADNVLSDKDVTQPLTLTLSRRGRGDGYRGRLRSANRPYSTPPIDPKPSPPRGEEIIYPGAMRSAYWHPTCLPQGRGDGYRGRLRSANRPYGLIAPCASSRGGRGDPPAAWCPILWNARMPNRPLSNPYQLWQTGSLAVKTGSLGQGAGSQPVAPRSLPNSRSFSSVSGWSA